MGLINNGRLAGNSPLILANAVGVRPKLDGRTILLQTGTSQYFGIGVGLPPGKALSPAIKPGGIASRVRAGATTSAPFFATNTRTGSADGVAGSTANFFAHAQRTGSATGVGALSVSMVGRGVTSATLNIGAQPSPEAIAGEIMATIVDDGYNLREVLRIMSAALAGKVSGAGSNAPVFRSIGDTTDRITATTTSAGNRTSVTLDPD